jgi:uncharacterized protein
MHDLIITVGEKRLRAQLNDSPTAQQILAVLPLEENGNVWGDEIYFSIPVTASEASDAHAEVTVGALAYWPPGKALCIFFGPTPVSRNGEPRAYSPVNVVGQLLDDPSQLRGVRNGVRVQVALFEE